MKKTYNLILIYDKNGENILFCTRTKEPYKGLYNLIGGKVNQNEIPLDATYRELYEETNISKNDIELYKLMDFNYYMPNQIFMEVYIGKLNKDINSIEIYGNENPLLWLNKNEFTFIEPIFAGDGNLNHIISIGNLIIDKLPKIS